MVGMVISDRQSAPPQGSSFNSPRRRLKLYPSQLRWVLVKVIVLLTAGIILLAYGYGNDSILWRIVGYLNVLFAFTFLGGLLHQTNT